MNQDSATPPSSDDEGEALRAAAREEVRQRIQKNRPQPDPREAEQTRNRATVWYQATLNDLFGDRAMMITGIVALWITISSLFLFTPWMRWPLYYTVRFFDTVTGASLIPWAPWTVWTAWGGIFGGCLGYWLVAPIYGNRENRSLILLFPIFGMVVIGIMVVAFT